MRTFREDIAALPVDLAREPLRRVDRALRAFFRRVKAGSKPGYPRFRSRERYNSLALSAPGFRIEGNLLLVSKLGGSGCGQVRRKPLPERVHDCSCGLLVSRDQNATTNILRLGGSRGEFAPESSSLRNQDTTQN